MPVHLLLDARERGVLDRPVVREVEAQSLGRHHGALLPHMRAEDLSQGGVDQVRRGVVALDVAAAGLVDLREHGGRLELLRERAHDGARAVHLLDVGHVQLPPFPPYSSRIADLPAGLGVERILLQHHFDPVA